MRHTTHRHDGLAGGAQALVVSVPGATATLLAVELNAGYEFWPEHTRYDVPHVLEHLLAMTSQRYPAVNAVTNASTDARRNRYWSRSAAPDTPARMLDLLGEQLTRPHWDPANVATEIGNVREELARNLTLYGRLAWGNRAERAYPGRILGYPTRIQQLDAITIADLQRHYTQTHLAGNLILFAVGDFGDDGQGAKPLIDQFEQLAGRLPGGPRPRPDQTIGRPLTEPVVTVKELDSIYYDLGLYLGATSAHDRVALHLLETILSASFASRIYGQARKEGIAYGIGGEIDLEAGYGEWQLCGYVSPPNAERLFHLIASELGAVADGDLDQAELDAAIAYARGRTAVRLQSLDALLDWYAHPFSSRDEVLDLPAYLDDLGSVTVDDLTRVAQQLTNPNARGLGLVGPLDHHTAAALGAILLGPA